MSSRLWSFLRALFQRPRRGEPAKPSGMEAAAPVAPSASDEPAAAPIPAPEACEPSSPPISPPPIDDGEDVEEDEWADAEIEAADDEPDPFITGVDSDPEVSLADAKALRAEARAEALSGEHRIHLSSPAGPGTLAEALNLLLEEGLVEAQFVETGEDAPYILYRPVS